MINICVHESRFCWYPRNTTDIVETEHQQFFTRGFSFNNKQGRFEYACANCGEFDFYAMATWRPGKVCYSCMCKLGLLPKFACRNCDDGDMDDVTVYSRRQPDKRRESVTPEVRLCAGCDRPLPADARPNQKTHNAACRQAAKRKNARIKEKTSTQDLL